MRRLIVNPGTANAWEIPLAPGVFSLGRDPQNDFPVEHTSVSSEHCLITVTDSGVTVKDLGSTNGTFVNDAPTDETPLAPGQTLRLGDVVLRLESDTGQTIAIPPPDASPSGSAAAFCKFHRHTFARLHCPKCGGNYCDACVSLRQGRTFCRSCAVECEALAIPVSDGSEDSFVREAGRAFAYPLQGDGVILLAGGTVFFLLLNVAKFFLRFMIGYGSLLLIMVTIFGAGYLTAYLRSILLDTSAGEDKMPDWPDFTDFGSLASPFFQLVGTVIFSFGPAIGLAVYAALATQPGPWLGWVIAAAVMFGCVYFPMAFMAVAMFDSIGAVNPVLIVPSILRIPLAYLFTVALFAVILLARWFGEVLLPRVLPVPILPSLLSEFLGLYFLAVEVRILGLLYRFRKSELGWFRS